MTMQYIGRRERNSGLRGRTGYLQGAFDGGFLGPGGDDGMSWGEWGRDLGSQLIPRLVDELLGDDNDNPVRPVVPPQPKPSERPPLTNPAAGDGGDFPWGTVLLVAGGAYVLWQFVK